MNVKISYEYFGLSALWMIILHSNLISYEKLQYCNIYGWIICILGYTVNLHSKIYRQPYGVLHRNNGPLHMLLRITVALFIALILNSQFSLLVQLFCILCANICLFIEVEVESVDAELWWHYVDDTLNPNK
jgi:hypothetical protein